MGLFDDKERFYGKIDIEFDSTKKGELQQQIVKGDEITISSLIGALIKNLLESGFDREILEHAINQGLKDGTRKNAKVQVKEIHISKENTKEFEALLKKIMGNESDMEAECAFGKLEGENARKFKDFMDNLFEGGKK